LSRHWNWSPPQPYCEAAKSAAYARAPSGVFALASACAAAAAAAAAASACAWSYAAMAAAVFSASARVTFVRSRTFSVEIFL